MCCWHHFSVCTGQTNLSWAVHCPGHEAKHWPLNAVSAYPNTTHSLSVRFVSDRAPSEGQCPVACHGSLTTIGEGKSPRSLSFNCTVADGHVQSVCFRPALVWAPQLWSYVAADSGSLCDKADKAAVVEWAVKETPYIFHVSTSRTAFGSRSVLLRVTPHRQNLRGSDARLPGSGSWWLR
jgi:hypothetical protein